MIQKYDTFFPSFIKEKEEAKNAFVEYKKNKNNRAKITIINAYLDIIRLTVGEYAYNNHLNFIIKGDKQKNIEFENALNEFKLR